MLKVATPIQLPNLSGFKHNDSPTTDFRANEDEEVKIPNISSFYRSPYSGRIRCKKVSNHPSIVTEAKKNELPVISNFSCESGPIELTKSEVASTGSTTCSGEAASTGSNSESSDNHSDISSSNSSGLRGILSNRERKSRKKTEKRVQFHEQLEDVREVNDISCRPPRMRPHPLSKKIKENNQLNKLSLRSTVSDSDLFRKRKHKYYDIDRQSQSLSDIENISIETISPGSLGSTYGSNYSDSSKQTRSIFKSPIRHSYQQNSARDEIYKQKKKQYSSPKQNVQCPSVAFRESVGKRPESVLSIYSPKVLKDSNGQQFVVCRLAIPNHEDFLFSNKNENILKLKPGLKPVLPEELATINTSATNFCNRDKASRIMRWLDNVDDIHSKEGRYAELFDSVFNSDRTG